MTDTDLDDRTIEPSSPSLIFAFTFNHALRGAGIDPARVRLVRHQERGASGLTPYDLWVKSPALLDRYQAKQSPSTRAKFGWQTEGLVWASFVVTPDGSTLFVGLYDVDYAGPLAVSETHEITLQPETAETTVQYVLQPKPELSELSGRLFVDWGDGARAWVQRADRQDKPVIELKRFRFEPPFPGLLAFREPISKVPALPASWCVPLSATKGVYLLACPDTGVQYVGSATGEEGFLGRWMEYAKTGHGGNIGLRTIDTTRFTCSILEVAGSGQTTDDIVRREIAWKEKLLSRTLGLNRN